MGKKTWGVELKKEFDRKFWDCSEAILQLCELTNLANNFRDGVVFVAKLESNFNISRLAEIRPTDLIVMLRKLNIQKLNVTRPPNEPHFSLVFSFSLIQKFRVFISH